MDTSIYSATYPASKLTNQPLTFCLFVYLFVCLFVGLSHDVSLRVGVLAGTALMGLGTGQGKTRAVDAAIAAISSPLLGMVYK